MNRIHHIRRLVTVLTGLAASLVAAAMGGTAAFAATRTFPPPEPPPGPMSRIEPVAHNVVGVTSGMTGWQIALIAVGAAIVGAVVGAIVAVLLNRARAAQHHMPAAA
jgi:hypothetical protein